MSGEAVHSSFLVLAGGIFAERASRLSVAIAEPELPS